LSDKSDVVIVGAGVLGTTIALWLSSLCDYSITLVEKEASVAFHTSSRNTGVVHRPFYLNPDKKKTFIRAALKSYSFWSSLAKKYNLPWVEVGTLEVATDDAQVPTLNQCKDWAMKNGLGESEIEILDSQQVRNLEPLVRCIGAIYSKTDTAVDYGEFTNCVFKLAHKNGVRFISNNLVVNAREDENGAVLNLLDRTSNSSSSISCDFLINAAGGGAIDIAHKLGVAKEYTDLHFRGEYWVVDDSFGLNIKRNIYSVAKHKEFPFLDPHFIVRASGKREVGPNAVLVSGPGTYKGLSSSKSELVKKVFERPNSPKLRLFTNSQFLSLAWEEWRSSISRKEMCNRVKQFIPSLGVDKFRERGLAGIRSFLIDDHGFVPEAIVAMGKRSIHILNYNSPGATGAPSYSAYIVNRIIQEGYIPVNSSKNGLRESLSWDFDFARNL